MSWNEFSEDLCEFGEQLNRFSETQRTSAEMQALAGYFRKTWRTSRSIDTRGKGIYIPPPKQKGLFPRLSEITDANIIFAFELGDQFENDHMPIRADFQVLVSGSLDLNHSIVELEDHWRVDSHTFPDPPPREPHPYIHFQRGGHAQDLFAAKQFFVPGLDLPPMQQSYWKSLMQSPGPRIPFLPHCPILAIDFAIGQHDGNVWSLLRNSPEYRLLIQGAQERLWQPFFDGLSKKSVRQRWMGSVII